MTLPSQVMLLEITVTQEKKQKDSTIVNIPLNFRNFSLLRI